MTQPYSVFKDTEQSSMVAGDAEKLPLSGFIICMNEEEYLGNCIESLGQCSEIVIVDSGSTDGTKLLIDRYLQAGWPIRFFHNDWPGYAAQKQFALEQCRFPWCLSIDSDERLDEELQNALPALLQAPENVHGFRVARRPYLIGYGYTPKHVRERKNLRLLRNGKGSFDLSQKVHEGIVAGGVIRDSKLGSLLHYRPLNIDEQILKENKYSTLKADQLFAEGCGPRRARLIINPVAYFLRLYIEHNLWRCGFQGYIQAMTGAVYAFLTEAKLYQRNALKVKPNFDDLERDQTHRKAA